MNFLQNKRLKVADFQDELSTIQGHILRPHGGNFQSILHLKFTGSQAIVQNLIGMLPITSAAQQLKDSESYKQTGESQTFYGLYLSSKGVSFLNINGLPKSEAFEDGMENRNLRDPELENWESQFQNDKIDALLLIADDNIEDISVAIKSFEDSWKDEIQIIAIQKGQKLENEHGQAIEHFGYVDGISQPLFYYSDFTAMDKDGEALPIAEKHWNPEASLSLVLVKEEGYNGYGSFLVYRKLEQNIKRFKEQEALLAHSLGLTGDAEEMAGAMMVGRFENGLAIERLGTVIDVEDPSFDNDFSYKTDPDAQRCPYHAHIRKSNPRGDNLRIFGISDEEERAHRIVRRGITYDDIGRNGNLNFKPEGGVGLLFLCFQSSIENQFEFIQKNWVNNNDFPKPFTGIDPVIGQGQNRTDCNNQAAEQKWKGINGDSCPQSMSDFVRMRGGGYFYAPSITCIQSLKTK